MRFVERILWWTRRLPYHIHTSTPQVLDRIAYEADPDALVAEARPEQEALQRKIIDARARLKKGIKVRDLGAHAPRRGPACATGEKGSKAGTGFDLG